jgi:hypothetical protein
MNRIHRGLLCQSRRHFLGTLALASAAVMVRGQEKPKLPPIRQLTRGPKFHWFAYYDKLQFSPDNRFVLCNQSSFENRSPRPDDVISMALQPDGKVILGVPFSLNHPQLRRLNPNGLVDDSFHPDTNLLWANALAVQPDGKILVNNACREHPPTCPGLLRLHADGSVDPSFQAPPIAALDQGIETFAVQPDGKIQVGGLILEAGGLPYGGIARLQLPGLSTAGSTRRVRLHRHCVRGWHEHADRRGSIQGYRLVASRGDSRQPSGGLDADHR